MYVQVIGESTNNIEIRYKRVDGYKKTSVINAWIYGMEKILGPDPVRMKKQIAKQFTLSEEEAASMYVVY